MQAKLLWHKIDLFEKQIHSAMQALEKRDSKRFRSEFLNPLEAPVSSSKSLAKKIDYSLENCIGKMNNIMKVTSLISKFGEELLRRTAFSLFKVFFSALDSFDERVQSIQIAVEERRSHSRTSLRSSRATQRSNYAKLANELILQSNSLHKCRRDEWVVYTDAVQAARVGGAVLGVRAGVRVGTSRG